MSYLEKLRGSARKRESIACMGLDPVVEAMPETFSKYGIGGVHSFLENIFGEMLNNRIFPGAFKLNQGFWVRHDRPRALDFKGSIALGATLESLSNMFPDIPVILDSKRGDIAKSSANYAAEAFDSWGADAVTVSPYMGTDSVEPFTTYCDNNHQRGVYVLCRTTNTGATDLQNRVLTEPSYHMLCEHVARLITESWSQGRPGVGAVVGATSLDELNYLAGVFKVGDIPLLIPGVGGQGGKADEVVARLRDAGYDLRLVRINSSSGLTHPWGTKEKAPDDYARVCVAALHKLNIEIGYKA